jgi:hypothetical protein
MHRRVDRTLRRWQEPRAVAADRSLNRVQIRWPVVALGVLISRSTRERALLMTSR